MNIFEIYTHLNDKEDTVLIKNSIISCPALLLQIFWALYHRMWYTSILLFIINTSLYAFYLKEKNNYIITVLLYILITFIFSSFAKNIKEFNLINNGYKLTDIVIAKSIKKAELKFLNRNINKINDK